jgi:hypothetical protein
MHLNLAALFSTNADHAQEARGFSFSRSWVSKGIVQGNCRVQICCVLDFTTGPNMDYCQTIHGAVAAAHLDGNEELVQKVKLDFANAGISQKLKALLVIAGNVQKGASR